MMTYDQYLKTIQDKESKATDKYHKENCVPTYERVEKAGGLALACMCYQKGRTMQEVSIEIMGMMLKDFLKDFRAVTSKKV